MSNHEKVFLTLLYLHDFDHLTDVAIVNCIWNLIGW